MADEPLHPGTPATRSHLLELPSEILAVILRNITDLDSLFAWTQSCRRTYEIYDCNRAQCNTRGTLDTLTKRGIELQKPWLFADVTMKDDRKPSTYLEPAIRALHHGQYSLSQDYCQALLGLWHFIGYDEDGSGGSGWRYRVVTTEGGLLRHCSLHEDETYYIVTLGQMSDEDLGIVAQRLWSDGM